MTLHRIYVRLNELERALGRTIDVYLHSMTENVKVNVAPSNLQTFTLSKNIPTASCISPKQP